jgi:hypothetical protein
MAIPILDVFLSFVGNPTFGLPFFLLAVALVVWLLWDPGVPLVRTVTRLTFRPAASDPVSRGYYALKGRQYSRVVVEAQRRLDWILQRRLHLTLSQLPVVPSPRFPLVGASLGDLRRARSRLIGFYLSARRIEQGSPFRWAFWRSPAREEARFVGKLERFLRECDYLGRTLEAVK